MPWKDSVASNPPMNFSVDELHGGRFRVQWRFPKPARDGDLPVRYVVYRSLSHPVDVTDASNIVAIIAGSESSYVDQIARPSSLRYYYALTALDRGNNESEPTTEEAVVVSEIAEIMKRFVPRIRLGGLYPNPADGIAFVPYEIDAQSPVWMKILDGDGNTLQIVVEDMKAPGKYIAAVNTAQLRGGTYQIQLVAGSQTLTEDLVIRK